VWGEKTTLEAGIELTSETEDEFHPQKPSFLLSLPQTTLRQRMNTAEAVTVRRYKPLNWCSYWQRIVMM